MCCFDLCYGLIDEHICFFVVDLELELKNMMELELEVCSDGGWGRGIFFLEGPFSSGW
jgi:hypothetical protein